MCLIHFQLQNHPIYKLIVIANRDEFYKRPTEQAHFWPDAPFLLAGRDLEKKGTWSGITRDGRFATLTNIRDLSLESADKKSRGSIVTDFLTSEIEPTAFLEKISKNRHDYAGFNILTGNTEQLFHYNNLENKISKVTTGTHSLSNATLNSNWPKMVRGRQQLQDYLQNRRTVEIQALFEIMENVERPPDDQLPDTGVGIEFERVLASSFIKSANYGTRSSTVITVDYDDHVTFHERTYDKGIFAAEKNYQFTLAI